MTRLAPLTVLTSILALAACRTGPQQEPAVGPSASEQHATSTSTVGIAVRVALPGVLHATVQGPDGAPVAGALVWVPGGGVSATPQTPAFRVLGDQVSPVSGATPSLVAPPGSALSVSLQGAGGREVSLMRGDEVAVSRTLPPGGTAGFPLSQEGLYTFRCAPQACSGTALLVAGAAGQTDAAGKVALIEVPPGEVIAHAWAEGLGELTAPVTIAPGPPAELSLRFPAPAAP